MRKSNAFSPHDEEPSFLKLASRCSGKCAGGEACADASLGSGSGRGVEKANKDSSGHIDTEGALLVNEKETGPFYKVYSMRSSESPDVSRLKLEDA